MFDVTVVFAEMESATNQRVFEHFGRLWQEERAFFQLVFAGDERKLLSKREYECGDSFDLVHFVSAVSSGVDTSSSDRFSDQSGSHEVCQTAVLCFESMQSAARPCHCSEDFSAQ